MRTSHESIQQTTASISIFDTSGIEINPTFGDGTQFCMCYTVAHTSGSYLDICLLVGGSTEIRIRDAVAVRIQSPQTNSKKALPQCKDVDTESYISTALIGKNMSHQKISQIQMLTGTKQRTEQLLQVTVEIPTCHQIL